jgi:probable rRNA maturation factor
MIETPNISGLARQISGETEAVSDDDPGPSPFSILIEFEGWNMLAGAEQAALRAYDACVEALPAIACREVSLLLADNATIAELNGQYRGKPQPTNVLSFPAVEVPPGIGPQPLGDIIIAYETLMREAKDEGKPVLDHLIHLTVHGVLHLAGYDHETDDDAERMEALEREILATIGVPDPYSGGSEEQPLTID